MIPAGKAASALDAHSKNFMKTQLYTTKEADWNRLQRNSFGTFAHDLLTLYWIVDFVAVTDKVGIVPNIAYHRLILKDYDKH